MHKNPHFRVLALTATPGSKPEDVQELCDALHISHIEIRDEFSHDLKQYIFDKVYFYIVPPREFVGFYASTFHLGNRTTYCGDERRNSADSFTPLRVDGGTTFTCGAGTGFNLKIVSH